MSTADHERSSTLPTLTWESVVADRPTAGRAGILDNPSGPVSVPAMPPPSRILSDPVPSDPVPSGMMTPEAAVVGATDDTTGQAIIAYVILRGGKEVTEEDLRNHVAAEIGPIAKPKKIYLTPDLPKTRSGKIMRRLLRDVAEKRELGDTTTLADPAVVSEIQERAVSEQSQDDA